jgi:hypothetical protein
MMFDASTFAVVGAAILGPTLLNTTVVDDLPVVPPREVKPFHREAMNVLGGAILDITATPNATTPNNSATTSAQARVAQLYAALLPSRGALSADSPGLPKLSGGECLQIVEAFTRALRAGTSDSFADDTYVFGAGLSQSVILGEILDGDTSRTGGFAGAVLRMVLANDQAAQNPTPAFNPRALLVAVADVGAEMDRQGVPNPLSQAPEVLDSIGTAITKLPETLGEASAFLASKLTGVIGETAAKILTSTPVLLGVAGWLTYKAVTK